MDSTTSLAPAIPAPADSADSELEEAAHFLLLVGRLLLGDGADSEQVATTVDQLAAVLGFEARLVVTYETLMLTLIRGDRFRTKAGRHLPSLGVNMRAVEAIGQIVTDLTAGRMTLQQAAEQLAAVERGVRAYPPLLVVGGMAVTTACLARLFGGDTLSCVVALLAGGLGTALRLHLARRAANPFVVAFLTALVSGLVGALGLRFVTPATPDLCIIAPSMIIVPGVPLINGIWDCVRNHMSLGLARLSAAFLTTLAIATGLFCVTVATSVEVPVGSKLGLLPLPQDAAVAGVAAIGFALLFNVPPRLVWAAMLCGAVSHCLRTGVMMLGVALWPATLVGATGAGILALGLAWRFRVPPAAFAFPGVVAMVPGAFAFRAVIGSLRIVEAGADADPRLVGQTISLMFGCALTMGAIAIGLAVPLAFLPTLMQRGVPGKSR
ncbi:MAG: threonine/serine exporter family protein [Proteobacteria bacterium]|nr:threonine/serine exporter family protein [Pseudomonadota bacterium]